MEVEVASQNSLHEVCLQTAADWGWQRSSKECIVRLQESLVS